MNLIIVAPLLSALCTRWIVGVIDRIDAKKGAGTKDPSTFKYARGVSNAVGFSSCLVPMVVFLLPDSAVAGLRFETDVFGLAVGGILAFAWIYLRMYKIKVQDGFLDYGAFFTTRVNLTQVTRIRYHWVNKGIQLKLFANKKRLAIFEGGVVDFDRFAQRVRAESPSNIITEVFGQATFHGEQNL